MVGVVDGVGVRGAGGVPGVVKNQGCRLGAGTNEAGVAGKGEHAQEYADGRGSADDVVILNGEGGWGRGGAEHFKFGFRDKWGFGLNRVLEVDAREERFGGVALVGVRGVRRRAALGHEGGAVALGLGWRRC